MRAPAFLPASLLVISSCAQQPPPTPAAAQPAIVQSPVEAPSSAADAAPARPAPCIPEPYRKGWVSDAFSQDSSAVFCLALSEKDQRCWTALQNGLADAPARSKPSYWPHRSSAGTHTLDSDARSVKVCPAAAESSCKTLSLKGFPGADQSEFPSEIAWHVPADANPDGTRIMVVRHEGKRSEKVFVETYDTRTAKRLGRFPIRVDQFVTRVAWIGRLALLTVCVEEGPGCSARLFDPSTGKLAPYGTSADLVNVYGIENPAHRASGDTWAVVATDGSRVLFVDSNTGSLEGELQTGLAADVESGVEATRVGPDRLAIISGAPRAGDMVVVDLAARKLADRFSAPACPAD